MKSVISQYSIITILDTISETSMPLNEFVLYRYKNDHNTKQYVIVCDKKHNSSMKLPEGLKVFYVENNVKLMKQTVKSILAENKKNEVKCIVHLHQLKSAMTFYKSMFFEKKQYKVLFTVHSVYKLRNTKYKIASIVCSMLADRVTCVSESGYQDYSKIVKCLKGKNISFIENGVDLLRVDSILKKKDSVSYQNELFHFVYVGRVIPIKNQKVLINAFKDLEGCDLTFIGAEGNDKEISGLIDELQLTEKIHITGMIERNKVFELLKASNVYVSSSLVEGLPVSVLEAMAVGLPVILSDINPHKEIAKKSAGVKIIKNTVDEWKNVLKEYKCMVPSELRNLGTQCRRSVEENFSLEKMHKLYEKEYEKLI